MHTFFAIHSKTGSSSTASGAASQLSGASSEGQPLGVVDEGGARVNAETVIGPVEIKPGFVVDLNDLREQFMFK